LTLGEGGDSPHPTKKLPASKHPHPFLCVSSFHNRIKKKKYKLKQ